MCPYDWPATCSGSAKRATDMKRSSGAARLSYGLMDYAQLRNLLVPLVTGLKDAGTHTMLRTLCEELGLPVPPDDGSKLERMTACLNALADRVVCLNTPGSAAACLTSSFVTLTMATLYAFYELGLRRIVGRFARLLMIDRHYRHKGRSAFPAVLLVLEKPERPLRRNLGKAKR